MRMMCTANCIITDDYDSTATTCRHCGHAGLVRSEHVDEDHWIIHHSNMALVHHLEELLHAVKVSVKSFEDGWDSTWNTQGPAQLQYGPPDDRRGWLELFERD